MRAWWRWTRLVLTTAVLVAVYFLVPVSAVASMGDVARIAGSVLVLVLLTLGIALQVRLQLYQEERHVDGLVLALIIGVLAFALGFYALELHSPGQFDGLHTRLDALYFTMSTILTIGYGDVHAAGQLARGLVVVQMLFNAVAIATAGATLTTRVRERARQRAETRRGEPLTEPAPTPDRRGDPT